MLWKNTAVLSLLAAVFLPSVSANAVRGARSDKTASLKKRRLMGGDMGGDMGGSMESMESMASMESGGGPTMGVSRTEGEDFAEHGCEPNDQGKLCICHGSADHWNYICPAQISHHAWGKTDQNGGGRRLKVQLGDYCPGDVVEGHGKLTVVGNKCVGEGSPSTSGDPHFTTWQSKKFDFHGGCDLVLVDDPMFNNGQGLTIHIRTKIVRWWSYVESAVIKIGSDSLEVKAGEERAFWFNGERGDSALTYQSGPMPFTVGGFRVRFRIPFKNTFQFKIFLDNDVEIVLKSVKEFLRVDIKEGTEDLFGSAVGLMGEFGTGNMLARDGKTVMEDPNEFGKEWQVLESEPKLFHNLEGVQHPTTCAMPTMLNKVEEVVEGVSRRLAGASISPEMAADACAHAPSAEFDDCVSDVLATDDLALAGAY